MSLFDRIGQSQQQTQQNQLQQLKNDPVGMGKQRGYQIPVNKATHALKSLATYEAMKGSSEYGGSYYGGSNAEAMKAAAMPAAAAGQPEGISAGTAGTMIPIVILTDTAGKKQGRYITYLPFCI